MATRYIQDFKEAIKANTLSTFIRNLPKLEEHLQLIESFETYIELEDVIFVHGDVVPDMAPKDREKNQLLWIREEFHAGYRGEKQ